MEAEAASDSSGTVRAALSVLERTMVSQRAFIALSAWARARPGSRFFALVKIYRPHPSITGDIRHFPAESCAGVRVEMPRDYLEQSR